VSAIGVVLLMSTVAGAEAPPARDEASQDDGIDPDGEPSAGLRTLGVITSLVPGVLLHGSGHFVIGRRSAAYRLLAVQGIGFGMVVIAGLPIVLTAANRYISREAAVVGALGVGLWAITWQADIFGALVPLASRGETQPTLSHLEVEAGYRYVHDPQFRYASFAYNALEFRTGGLRLRPSTMVALDDGNRRLRLLGAYRFFGPRAHARPASDGTYFELQTAVTHHAFLSERFSTLTPEVFATGRLDLHTLHPHLSGMFGELGVGFGLQLFDIGDRPLGDDVESLLLVRMGRAFYLGGPDAPSGEVFSYYDHRHDDYVGGFTERAIGVPGHIGFSGRAWLHDNVGFNAIFEAGAAIMAGGSLMFRETPP
jgi:hypothetical protein